MTKEELIQKLSDLEWEDFEVKAARAEIPKDAWETVSAFSNTSGGWLLFGVKQIGKKFEIQGVTNPEKIEQDFLNTIRGGKFNVFVPTKQEKYTVDGNTVIAFYIPVSKNKPVYYNSLANTFIRRGSSDQRATNEEIDSMYRDQTFGTKTSEIATGTSRKSINDASLSRYRDYMSRFNPTVSYNRYNEADFLQKLRIMDGDQCTLGGLLFLGNRDAIERFFPDFRIDLLEIPGTSYSNAKVRYTFRIDEYDNLWEYYFECISRLKSKVDVEYKMGNEGFAKDVSPGFDALREALVNMLMHSDHFSPACPRIRIFTDHIEFYNPGGMPKPIEELKGKDISLPRNPIITKLFRVVKLAENAGYGLDNIEFNWKSYNNTLPTFDVDFDSVIVKFQIEQEKVSQKTPESEEGSEKVRSKWEEVRRNFGEISARTQKSPEENIADLRGIYGVFTGYLETNFGESSERIRREFGETLEELQRKNADKIVFVLMLIAMDKSISAEDLASILGVSTRTIKRYLKKLSDSGIVSRVGPDKTGVWQIN
ncbi:MAG: putative DNA binding domain-containing protein [Prolixibacteraceae bacterium]|nr:putative DNA binding domain-containing protein [Prolixibacteraceae bacterium]